MNDELIGMLLSIVGMLVTIASFQAKAKRNLLILQTIGTLFYLFSYIFSGGGIAVMLNVIYLARNFLFMRVNEDNMKKKKDICIALCISYAIAYVCFVVFMEKNLDAQIWNLLPIIGAFFGTIGLINRDVNKFRLWKYGDSLAWFVFNMHIGIGALGGIFGEVFNLISLTIGIFRYREIKTDKTK